MNISTNPKKLRGFERYVKVDNVSRRSILKGLGLAGGFVLAAPVMSRPAFAAYQTGADKMPHGTVVDPRVFVAIAPDGIVTIVAHRAEMGTGVRTSLPMIVAEEMEADWSRVRVQQAHGDEVKFGNQDTDGSRSTRHYLMPMRQIGASARSMLEGRRGEALGRAGDRSEGGQSRGRPQRERTPHRLWRSGGRCRQGIGAERRRPEAERPEGFPLSGQGPDQHGRSARHHGRHRALRRRRPPARHEIRRHRPAAGDRRQGRVVRRSGSDEGFRRREGDGGQGLAVAFEIPAARRRRGDRAQHRRCDQGPRRPEDRLGRRRQRQIQLGRLPRRTGGGRAQSPAWWCARKATWKPP